MKLRCRSVTGFVRPPHAECALVDTSQTSVLRPLRNEIYHSNRSAACAALKRWDEALRDGRRAVQLKPGWAKGHARLGAAFLGMELWSEVRLVPNEIDTRLQDN